jgi:hypothetical protein
MCRFQVKKKEFFRNFIAIMLFGVVGVFISFGIISAGWCTWTTSLLCDIYMLHRFVLAFLRSPGTLVLCVASISISWTIWRYFFWRNSEETLFSAQFCCEDSTLVVRFLLEQDKLLTCVYAVVHVRWMLSERKEEPSDGCSRVICLLPGTRYMFTKLGLKKLSMRDYLGVYSPLSHSSACLWTRRTPLKTD